MQIKIKNRYPLKRKEVKIIFEELQKAFNCNFFDDKTKIESGEIDGIKMILVDDEPCFVYYENKIVFTLHGVNRYKLKERFIVVDMGAIRFITNGADVMAPGVVDADKNICENELVWVCDEKHHKPLAIGFALMNGEQMIHEDKGKAVKVIHYVGDNLWNIIVRSL